MIINKIPNHVFKFLFIYLYLPGFYLQCKNNAKLESYFVTIRLAKPKSLLFTLLSRHPAKTSIVHTHTHTHTKEKNKKKKKNTKVQPPTHFLNVFFLENQDNCSL